MPEIFALTGGLGNQIFQYVAARSITKGDHLYFDSSIGGVRNNRSGEPEIFSFELPNEVTLFSNRKFARAVAKSNGYVLRMGIKPKQIERIYLVKFCIELLAKIVTSLYFLKWTDVIYSKGLGFSEITVNQKNSLVIGYFQSYRWFKLPQNENAIRSLRIKEPGPELIALVERAKEIRPLIVHIRLGDYKSEKTFGILGKNYYQYGIDRLMKLYSFKEIWAFSDETDLALEFIPTEYLPITTWIREVDGSASSTLELMRHGSGYVIGNSTFSYWAALLSYSNNPHVIAPRPWFFHEHEPLQLIPENWERFDGGHN